MSAAGIYKTVQDINSKPCLDEPSLHEIFLALSQETVLIVLLFEAGLWPRKDKQSLITT